MSTFTVVDRPRNAPTCCLFCGEFEGPFIDTHTELPGYGWIYVCGPNAKHPGCVGQMATLLGGLSVVDRKQVEADLAVAEQVISELQAEVAAYKQLKDVQEFLRKRQTRTLVKTDQEKAVA